MNKNETDISKINYISQSDVKCILDDFYSGSYKDRKPDLALDIFRIYKSFNRCNVITSMSSIIEKRTHNRRLSYNEYSLYSDIVKVLNDDEFILNVSLYNGLLSDDGYSNNVKHRVTIITDNPRNGETEFITLIKRLGEKSLLELLYILKRIG